MSTSLPPLVEPAAELTPRRGLALQPPPDHPRPRRGRAEAPQERARAGHRRRRAGLADAALPGRRRCRHHRDRRVRRRRRVQPAAPDHPRRSPTSGGPRPRAPGTRSRRSTRWSTCGCTRCAWSPTTRSTCSRSTTSILDGTDNFATRYLVNDAAVLAGKPYVWGSIYRFEGQVSVFWEDAPDGSGPELPRPVSRAAAAGHGAVVRRGRRARHPVRLDRVGDGHRGHQAASPASASRCWAG